MIPFSSNVEEISKCVDQNILTPWSLDYTGSRYTGLIPSLKLDK